MKLRCHLIWAVSIFIFVIAPLFYVLFVWGFLRDKEWNDGANITGCQVTANKINEDACKLTEGGRVGYPSNKWCLSIFGCPGDRVPQCYEGVASLSRANVTREFEVAHGFYEEVNNTVYRNYSVGKCVQCVAQIANASDFLLHMKPVIPELVLSITVPGFAVMVLIAWVVYAACFKKHKQDKSEYL